MSTEATATMAGTVSQKTVDDVPRRRLSRNVAADLVAIGDILAVVLGGLLPALIYAIVGNIKIDQVLVVQSVLVAGFITHLCLRFRGMYGLDREHVWAVGQGSDATGRAIYRWDGTRWEAERSLSFDLAGVWAADPDHVWVVGQNGGIQFRYPDP